MSTILARCHDTIVLDEGKTITVHGNINSSGAAYKMVDSSCTNSTQSWTISASTYQVLGPFVGTAYIFISCALGSIDFTVNNGVVSAAHVETDTSNATTGHLIYPVDGSTVSTGGGGGSAIIAYDEGVSLTATLNSLNFVGGGVTATVVGNDVTVSVPADAVTSVAGYTGVVTLTKSDIGLSAVDNTSDANKPVSTAQAAADTTVLNSAKSYADGLVVGLWDDRGNFDASSNVFPSSGGSGSAGAILKGDIWTTSIAGTLGGVPVATRQTVRAMIDAPGQTAANWAIGLANTDIDNSITSGVTGRAPSEDAVYTALAGKQDSSAKDATGGYVGMTLYKINFKNSSNTFTSFFTNSNTAARTYTFPDYDSTVATIAGTETLTSKTLTAPTINGGTHTAVTSFGIRSSGSGAFDLTLLNTENLTAGRSLTVKVNDTSRTLDTSGNLTFAGAFTTSGAFASTFTMTNTTTVTFPTSGTLATLGGTETLTAKTLTTPTINGGSATALTSFGIRSSGTGAFDLTLANTENLTAGRTLTIKVNDAARTLDTKGNLTFAGAFTTSGAFGTTFTMSGTTSVTFPTSGTLLSDAAVVTVAQGGIGVGTLTGIAKGNGTSAFTAASAGVDYSTAECQQNSQSAAYTLVLGDAGKHIYHPSADTTARTFTIPANSSVAYPIGTVLTFVNDTSAGTVTIAITTDTLKMAGSGSTGSRTLAANGIATAMKITSTSWIINGAGLS